ncbi:MAG: chemotaxis protein CheA [Magnetococcales bacterium]|nr:chemotaxis protein CheA [Magnetococcales bacterium]
MFDQATQQALLEEFFAENREALNRIERGLLQLETVPSDSALLNAVFRDMHTVKGNCRLMGFEKVEELTHASETLLEHMRDGDCTINQEINSALLGVLDAVRKTLEEIKRTGAEGDVDFSDHISKIERLLMDIDDQMASDAGKGGFEFDLSESDTTETAPSTSEESRESAAPQLESVRLSIARLDILMNRIGELGATFNQLKYLIQREPDQLEQVLEEHGDLIHVLQDEVLKYRLQPIGMIWESYHRLVRDLAVETGKKVLLDLRGEETEVDRNILVSIKELLGHLIRNAIDHGIEKPEDRTDLGKKPIGRVEMTAAQRHGQIYLDIRDDGRGIDGNKIRDKAIEKGLITSEQAMTMNEQDMLNLIMLPGMTTAQQVSRISGRGTGMDVVKAALDKVGGTISITSDVGVGSQFRLRIPQTMAIVPGLLVKNAGGVFAIPQTNIMELISFYGSDVKKNIEGKMQMPMVRLREQLLPLIPLQRVLARIGPSRDIKRELGRIEQKRALDVVILHSEERTFGLEVDGILGPASMVIKPMNRIFSQISVLAGSAVMPDGSVSFLLNVPEIINFID